MARDELVDRVQQRGSSKHPQCATERASTSELGQEGETAACIPLDWCPVSKHEPPALVAGFLGDRGEQPAGLVVRERKQSELLAPVELDGEPRRPATEPSGAGVEQDRARELGAAAFCHERSLSLTGSNSKASLNI
jgi:hypothetical protein